jgi:hypothetical protein
MISSEVQRTLVKSPPELWTELSDAAALGRHLGEFGEIRITRVEPEKAVEWEAEGASGTVLIKPSGWGTRVTLTVNRELPAPEEPVTPESAEAATSPPAAPVQTAAAPESAPQLEEPAPQVPKAATEAETAAAQQMAERGEHWQQAAELEHGEPHGISREDEGVPEEETAEWEEQWQYAEPEPRRGFLARLFGWRRRARAGELDQLADGADSQQWPEAEQPLEQYGEPASEERAGHWPLAGGSLSPGPECRQGAFLEQEQLEPEQPSSSGEEPTASGAGDAGAEPGSEDSAELKVAEEAAAEEVSAVLSAMLDRLGTAHHRPFSRA